MNGTNRKAVSADSAAPTVPDRGLAALLTAVFESWRDQSVSFLILRNYEGLPAVTFERR